MTTLPRVTVGVIYGISHPDEPNRIRYIGQTVQDLNKRRHSHFEAASKNQRTRIARWVRKHYDQRSELIFEVLGECYSREELNNLEISMIRTLRKHGQADLNIAPGGKGGSGTPMAEEMKERFSRERKNEGGTNVKTNWSEVAEMREMYVNGSSHGEIQERYPKLSPKTISSIVRGKQWIDPKYKIPTVRHLSGERTGRTRISDQSVRELRLRAQIELRKVSEWAALYGISQAQVDRILKNKLRIDSSFDSSRVKRVRVAKVKCTQEIADSVRGYCATNQETYAAVAERFGLTWQTVGKILRGERWA